jgi:drug/metabolite transporter (DMT)-like permease
MMQLGRAEPTLLLLAAGFFIGLIFPLGKLAGEAGIPPLLYAGLSACGAGMALAIISRASGAATKLSAPVVRYAVVSGLLTFAVPFGLLVIVIPHLGSGIPSILQSLTPILTLAIVYLLRLERPHAVRAAGLAAGLVGALIILLARNAGAGTGVPAAALGWYLVAFVTPLALAGGNVFRTLAWPAGERALPLAMLTLAAAATILLSVFLILAAAGMAEGAAEALVRGWWVVAVQSVATGIGYAFFFRLQQVGGPVYLSQISYVNTAVGLAFAVLLFGERISGWVWLAVLLVFAGVALVNRTQPAPRQSGAGATSY